MGCINGVLVVSACALLSGCTSVGKIQAGCEHTSRTFPELASCLRTSIASSDSSSMQNSPEVKLYLLKADQLSDRVKKKEISDLDARVELQTLYLDTQREMQQVFVNIRTPEIGRSASAAPAAAPATTPAAAPATTPAAAAAAAATRPRPMSCFSTGISVQCTNN